MESEANNYPTVVTPEGRPGFVLIDERATVEFRRADTRNGMRLEINSPRLRRRIRLDPVALESLTWQTPETLSEFLEARGAPARQARSVSPEPPSEGLSELTLINEFSTVHIKRVDTQDGPRLEVSSPRLQSSIQLDPATLEGPACQIMEIFAGLRETPLGKDTD
jgi:hypothetical protein